MTPTIPIDRGDLARIVAQAWPAAARAFGVFPLAATMSVRSDGSLAVERASGAIVYEHAEKLALRHMLSILEDRGIVVDHATGRVLGWAAVRIADLPPGTPARERYHAALVDGRGAALAPDVGGKNRDALWRARGCR